MAEPQVKITVEIPQDLHEEMKRTLPWGFRRHVLEAVLRLVMRAVREDGEIVIGAIMAGEYQLKWTGQLNQDKK